jgi:uncharacterized cupredoxin-like copper-binding protein
MKSAGWSLCLLLALAGCGGDDDELRVRNPSEAVHNVAVEQSRTCCRQPGNRQFGYTNTISPGQTARAVVKLSPGRYWAYCGVDGHWQGGMISRLIVK